MGASFRILLNSKFLQLLVAFLVIGQSGVTFCYGIDLVSTLLSQGSNSKLSLAQLKSFIPPEIVQKLLGTPNPELEETLRGVGSIGDIDPSQLQNILTRFKPAFNGKLNPELLQHILNGRRPAIVPPPHDHELRPYLSLSQPQPPTPPRGKFSSKFRRQRRPATRNIIRTTTTTTEISTNPDGTLIFDHVSDPNIRNHKGFGWRAQNFTTIDRLEDLMMDESQPAPTLIPLLADSEESGAQVTQQSPPGQWPPTTSSSINSEAIDEYTREPLHKIVSTEVVVPPPSSPTRAAKFRPSPIDFQAPLSRPNFRPNDDYDMEVRRKVLAQKSGRIPSYIRPSESSIPSRSKQDRILNPTQHGDGGHQFQESQIQPQYARPAHYPGSNFKGQYPHPPGHYSHVNSMYAPTHFHNKYHYLNPTGEQNLEQAGGALEKVDTSWGSTTFFILGGLVAASALVAFVLPSLLPGVTAAGKVGEVAGGGSKSPPSTPNNGNNDFWHEVKGLYSDLTHLARGDYTYFDENGLGPTRVTKEPPPDEEDEIEIQDTLTVGDRASSEEQVSHEHEAYVRNRAKSRIENIVSNATTASPILQFPMSTSTTGSFLSNYNQNTSSTNAGWSKVQLKIID